ncbi:MAG: c-type cytochrome [Chlorobium sp.]|nr:c-type cytochrome [Chlorobium sp.]
MSRFISTAICALFVCTICTSVASAAGNAVTGKAVYDAHCTTCHTAGIGGTPKLGDKAAWAPRIKQGEAVLTTHAIKGFKTPGSTGMAMMPKAGKPALSDQAIGDAVAYMVKSSK